MVTRTEAIKNFLNQMAPAHFSKLYNFNMECQVNVAQDGGERIEGEFKGRRWQGYSDGIETWKPFRIPYKANTQPEYSDVSMSFDLMKHAEAIGMTGWDWKNKQSKWVAFDFDAIVNHSERALTSEELTTVQEEASKVPWLTIYKSTSGQGLHVYVYLNNVSTDNHTEHAALARAILGKMSAITGYDFNSKVDVCGGNMWVWHRKMAGTNGLNLIKQGSILYDVPLNWREHIDVIKKKPKHKSDDPFATITSRHIHIEFDEEHKKLINFLDQNNCLWWYDKDKHLIVTHTTHLKEAHIELGFRGIFETLSSGKDKGHDHNCFMFPIHNGGWCVRRFTPGVQEHASWHQDGSGWTRCYYNQEPDLKTAAQAFGGIEDPKGGFVFREAEVALQTLQALGSNCEIGTALRNRETKIKTHKDGRIIVEVEHNPTDRGDDMVGWLVKKKVWTKVLNTSAKHQNELEVNNYDDLVRHLVTNSSECGWVIKVDGSWIEEPRQHVKDVLASVGYPDKDIINILGSSILKNWKIVNKPFQPEYPGNRQWNRHAAKLRFAPSTDTEDLHYPTWIKILNHCGTGLDKAVQDDGWCKVNGIVTGADYLKCWIASVFQEPTEPLPYLFFWGPQDSGKSIFHEAIELLLTDGYKRANAALINQQGFNAELKNAVICVIEELDLAKNKIAYSRIKDWVTGRSLLIHEKRFTPYQNKNSTHWIQCDNDHKACPIFPGDTRITMIYVDELDPMELIPKKRLIPLLEKEAPDFLAAIMSLELPVSNTRMNLPVVETSDKDFIETLNRTQLENFIEQFTTMQDGTILKFSDFYERFIEWMEPLERTAWSKWRVSKELPLTIPKGNAAFKQNQVYLGNIMWSDAPQSPGPKWHVHNGKLVQI